MAEVARRAPSPLPRRMPAIDPASLILTNALVSLALTAVLLVSRIGLGAEGRGIRTWVFGDVAITAARIVAAATIAGGPVARELAFPVVPGCLMLMGIVAHAHALRSVAGRPARPTVMLGQTVALAFCFYLLGISLSSLTHRIRLFDGMMLCGACVTLWLLKPLFRFWGARLIAAVMALAIAFQGVRFGALLLGIDVELPAEAVQDLRRSVRPSTMVLDLLIALLMTGAFALLQQERLRERIEHLLVTDALTGALNRHGIMPLLDRAWSEARRGGRSMSVVMLDIDHFKRVNDQHGHATGDQVLAGFARCVGAHLRQSDALSRWGGEEFLVLLTDTDLVDAHALAERLRRAVALTPLSEPGVRVTVSAGVASFASAAGDPHADTTRGLLQLLDAADRRLYLAKRQRNCVTSDEDAGGPPAGSDRAGDA